MLTSISVNQDSKVKLNSDPNTKEKFQDDENESTDYSVISRINNDVEKYTSSATRLAGGVNALVNVYKYPLGVGFYGYNGAIVDAIPEAKSIISNYFGGFNFSEIDSYKKLEAESVSTKSFFFDLLVLFGVFGFVSLLLILLMLKKNVRILKKPLLFGSLIYSIAALMVWSTGIGIYSLFLIFNVIINKEDEYE